MATESCAPLGLPWRGIEFAETDADPARWRPIPGRKDCSPFAPKSTWDAARQHIHDAVVFGVMMPLARGIERCDVTFAHPEVTRLP
jgi:hypothetical protein